MDIRKLSWAQRVTSADTWNVACVLFELVTGGDYLFDPASGSGYGKDDDHIVQMTELIEEIARSIALVGKYSVELFKHKGVYGELFHINSYATVPSVLSYTVNASFLAPSGRRHGLVPEQVYFVREYESMMA